MTRKQSFLQPLVAASTKAGWKRLRVVLGGALVLTFFATIRYYWGCDSRPAGPNQQCPRGRKHADEPARVRCAGRVADRPPPRRRISLASRQRRQALRDVHPAVVAYGEQPAYHREDLARECLRHHGKEVLESMVNKQLISAGMPAAKHHGDPEGRGCRDRAHGQAVQHPRRSVAQDVKQERNVTPEQYADDIVWPMLALGPWPANGWRQPGGAGAGVRAQYGPAVQVRLIACQQPEQANKCGPRPLRNPENFGNLAKNYSRTPPAPVSRA